MYSPIADYGIIGDNHTAALISRHGSIDWLCLPHFDSPALFLRLLDEHKGGYCEISVEGLQFCTRRYLENTNILETTFRTKAGSFSVIDFMPVHPRADCGECGQDVDTSNQVIRIFRGLTGFADFQVNVAPTFDYGRAAAEIERHPQRTIFRSPGSALHVLHEGFDRPGEGWVGLRFRLEAGQHSFVALAYARPGEQPAQVSLVDAERELEDTRQHWEQWSKTLEYDGPWREQVLRSALALKLLIFERTGAIVAAPTTSLPEWIGGTRNWDYRYTWLRDSSFTLIAFMELGYFGEARDFLHFLLRTMGNAHDLRVLYATEGHTRTQEQELGHLEGYWGSQPVRIGNGAGDQLQFDVFGELMQCIHLYWSHQGFEHEGESFEREFWPLVKRLAGEVSLRWREPDNGIWEVRGPRRHFVHSKGLCWVALDRALALARQFHLQRDANIAEWERQSRAIHEAVRHEGFNPRLQALVQSFGSASLDASILRLPILHMFAAESPHIRSTIAAIEAGLMKHGLVPRYDPGDDGINEPEGAFLACGFWLVEDYVLQGRLSDAETLFGRLCSLANDLGLLSEEADPATGQLLGNFPQGFSHVGLINAAVRLQAGRKGKHTSTHELIASR
jgi:GH15 family glucan-1,4-alpha-glucosidase